MIYRQAFVSALSIKTDLADALLHDAAASEQGKA